MEISDTFLLWLLGVLAGLYGLNCILTAAELYYRRQLWRLKK